jgi:hypothetical protein
MYMDGWPDPPRRAVVRRDVADPPGRPVSPNWWLALASYHIEHMDPRFLTIEERERIRRSQLAAWILLSFLIVDGLLVPIGLSDPDTMLAIAVVAVGFIIGIALNRTGHVSIAGWLVVALVDLGVMASLLSQTGLTVDSLPAYDLMLAAVVIAASILGPAAAAIVAAANIVLICGDFFLQAHAPDLNTDLAGYPSTTVGVLSLLGRPVGLQIVITVVAVLWVAGTERAIRRANNAEEIAALEHAVAEQRRQLETGVAQLLQTHVRLANGDFGARAPILHQDNMLWQVASSLNNLIARMQRMANADLQVQRATDEAQRLLAALRDAQAGRVPLWPAPSGTLIDPLITFFRGASGAAPTPMQPPPHVGRVPPPPSGPRGGPSGGEWRDPGADGTQGAPSGWGEWPPQGPRSQPL